MADHSSHIAFVERAYDDTYALLVAMRDYVAGPSMEDAKTLQPGDRLRLTHELSRVTRLLTNVMAWLMVQKAVAAGEMTREQGDREPAAQLDFLYDGDASIEELGRLPLAARSLIDRARRIGALVRQLDSAIAAAE